MLTQAPLLHELDDDGRLNPVLQITRVGTTSRCRSTIATPRCHLSVEFSEKQVTKSSVREFAKVAPQVSISDADSLLVLCLITLVKQPFDEEFGQLS